jgi:hypothetical protein
MTCLSVVQEVCDLVGVNRPNVVVSSSDQQVRQILGLVNREGRALAARHDWEVLKAEATFTTVATESQGDVETLSPGYKFIINGTLFNRTQQRPVYGPLNDQQWQLQKSSSVTGPYSQYRIRGGELLMLPTPTAGETCAFEYISKYWVRDTGSTTTRASYTADSDVGLLSEDLITLGAIWRWKQAKGFEYAQDFEEYEKQVNDAIARDGTKAVLSMAGDKDAAPGVLVPEGSWSL